MAADKICITGERIRELYEDHGYSQKEFADFLGISTAQLRRYEKDPDQSIRSDLLILMAKHFQRKRCSWKNYRPCLRPFCKKQKQGSSGKNLIRLLPKAVSRHRQFP